jgi:hypothetical protein
MQWKIARYVASATFDPFNQASAKSSGTSPLECVSSPLHPTALHPHCTLPLFHTPALHPTTRHCTARTPPFPRTALHRTVPHCTAPHLTDRPSVMPPSVYHSRAVDEFPGHPPLLRPAQIATSPSRSLATEHQPTRCDLHANHLRTTADHERIICVGSLSPSTVADAAAIMMLSHSQIYMHCRQRVCRCNSGSPIRERRGRATDRGISHTETVDGCARVRGRTPGEFGVPTLAHRPQLLQTCQSTFRVPDPALPTFGTPHPSSIVPAKVHFFQRN